jgi:DNA repair photolyase
MKTLADAGIQVGIGIAPTIPGLSTDIPGLLQRAKDCGATKAFINMLRLPGSVAPYFEKRLHEKLPTKADRVLNRIRDARGGKLNSSVFGERMRGKGQYWDAQEKLFEVYTRRLGFNEHRVGSERHSRANTFRRPTAQGSLFG